MEDSVLVPKRAGGAELKPAPEQKKPPKARSMKEMNGLLDRIVLELNFAPKVYNQLRGMCMTLKEKFQELENRIAVLEQLNGVKHEESAAQVHEESQHQENFPEDNQETDVRTKAAADGAQGV